MRCVLAGQKSTSAKPGEEKRTSVVGERDNARKADVLRKKLVRAARKLTKMEFEVYMAQNHGKRAKADVILSGLQSFV